MYHLLIRLKLTQLHFHSGNIWSQTWNNIMDISAPYPEKEAIDVTPQMKKQVRNLLTLIHDFKFSTEFYCAETVWNYT